MTLTKIALTTALIGTFAAPAFAQEATATTELNLRAEPSEFAQSQLILAADSDVIIEGCLEDGSWCKVAAGDAFQAKGWVNGAFLTVAEGTAPTTALSENGIEVIDFVTVVTDGDQTAGQQAITTAVAAGTVATSGAGVVVAEDLIGAVTEEQVLFVADHPVSNLDLAADVTIGGYIPEHFKSYAIPGSPFEYLMVNNTAVMVDPEDNRIVGIVN